MSGVDLVLGAVVENQVTKSVFADQPGCGERDADVELGEVDQQVVRGAARAGDRGPGDVGQLLPLGVHIDHLHLIDDPVSTSQNPLADGCFCRSGHWKRELCHQHHPNTSPELR